MKTVVIYRRNGLRLRFDRVLDTYTQNSMYCVRRDLDTIYIDTL